MTFLEKVRLIERVDQLIRMKATGSAEELARKLGISRSSVYELLDCMKSMGAEIQYCRVRSAYYYEEDKILAIGFVDKSKIRGGSKKILYYSQFVRDCRTNTLYL